MAKTKSVIELVTLAVSTDKTRPILNTPFGREFNGSGYLCGTNGQRMHCARFPQWAEFRRDDSPPAEQVVPWSSGLLGTIHALSIAPARAIPKAWNCELHLGATGEHGYVDIRDGRGNKIFGPSPVPVNWIALENQSEPTGLDLRYLLDALDFLETEAVSVWGTGKEIDPFAFTAAGTHPATADRLAVIMPIRILI